MVITKPYAKLQLDLDGISMLKKIERAGRISHRSEHLESDDSYLRFIKAVVVDHGDWSIVEHCSVSVEFYADRAFTHQLVRHRLFSYTQESQRFVNYTKKHSLEFIQPEDLTESQAWEWATSALAAEQTYNRLVMSGTKPEDARSILPNCTGSKILVTGNLRNWRHVFLMRTTKETQKPTRNIFIPLLEEFKTAIPILYDDITPNERQVVNLGKPR